MKADEPPNLDMPTATLAGAPPAAFLKATASARETPEATGTKSMISSPKQTTGPFTFTDLSASPLRIADEPSYWNNQISLVNFDQNKNLDQHFTPFS